MDEHEVVHAGVDVHPWGATEGDEEQVLEGLYGPPDRQGIYRGEAS